MGKVASKAVRPIKNFNVENRAHRALESEHLRSAPRHPSTATAIEQILQDNPEILDEQKKKHEKLDDFLKKVRVDSVGDNPEIQLKKSARALPEDRRKVSQAEYGFPEVENVPEGRANLRQVLEFISLHRLSPQENSVEKIARDYKLDATQVQHIVKYFQTLNMHIPKEMLKKNPKLLNSLDGAQMQSQTVKGMDDVLKLGQGVGEPQKTS